jgi:DNA-directed RNA polymerase subunit M/transcription elongation factor TFIIS
MNDFKILEKILGTKYCPNCNRTMRILKSLAVCERCGFFQELNYKDPKRNKKEKEGVQFRKIEDLIHIDMK